MAYNFPYLKDSDFLKRFDELRQKEQYAKLTVLTFDETPIQEIQGRVTGGNISLDGSSAMRRSGSVTLIADQYENDLTTTRNLLSINKKIELLIGFKNTTDEYTDYDIIWFPQGVFVIITPNISHGADGIRISLTLHDKMAMLNGECGGVLPASVVFDRIEDIDQDGSIVITQPKIYQIIQQLVHHFGGEQLGKIIIRDVDDKIKKVMQWTGNTPLFIYQQGNYYSCSTNYNQLVADHAGGTGEIRQYNYGDDVGFILTDFVYPTDLIGNAGDSVVTILDQIKNVLGNYEYFYDIHGNFRFQEIKNYLNTSYATTKINEMNMNDYLVDYTDGKSVYTFEDGILITSYSNSPQYQQIKNDFMVWGKRKSIDGRDVPIRYHLAIDKRPEIGNTYKVFFFTDPDDGIVKAKIPLIFQTKEAMNATKGQKGIYCYAADKGLIYKWDKSLEQYVQTPYVLEQITTNDFRTQLYMAGVASQPFGLDSNYYYTELKNEWPKLYEMRETQGATPNQIEPPQFKPEVLAQPSNIDFFLDFIDTPTALNEFSVQNIGRRTTTLVDDSINCIFQPENSNLILIQESTDQTDQLREECENRGQEYLQVDPQIYSMLLTGGALKSAYQEIRKELYQYTNYNEQVSINVLPIYYLQPNTRITIRDSASGIYGDYMIKSISLPLDVNEAMSINCVKAFERI